MSFRDRFEIWMFSPDDGTWLGRIYGQGSIVEGDDTEGRVSEVWVEQRHPWRISDPTEWMDKILAALDACDIGLTDEGCIAYTDNAMEQLSESFDWIFMTEALGVDLDNGVREYYHKGKKVGSSYSRVLWEGFEIRHYAETGKTDE